MAWRPIAPERRGEIEPIIRDIATAIAAAPAATARDHAERAILWSYLAESELVPDPDDVAGTALSAAIGELAGGRAVLGLFGGAAGIGWTVAHLADAGSTRAVAEVIDAALAGRLAQPKGEYDLVTGVVGFGVYALECGEVGHPLAERVVDWLARTARPRLGGVAWHTAPELLPAWQRETAPRGYWNLGLAHGAAGVIALLARMITADVARDRALSLLDGALTALLAAKAGGFAAWQSGGPDDQQPEPTDHPAPVRLAWCYNDLGVAVALAAAATATNDPRARSAAEALARSCAERTTEQAAIVDTALCHGAMGAAHLFDRLHRVIGDASVAAAAHRWLDRAIAMRTDQPLAGFPCVTPEGASANASLLEGAAGVALGMCSMICELEPAWDRLLLAELGAA